MPKIHFVYSVPPPAAGGGALSGPYFRFGTWLDGLFPGRYRHGRQFRSNLPSPYSITANVFHRMAHLAPTLLYDWQEKGTINLAEDDILLGHPHPDQNTIFRNALKTGKGAMRAVMMPLHHGIPEINRYAIDSLATADVILGIMGPYWFETIKESFLAPFAAKITQLDMAIDPNSFPRIKTRFNPPGKRGFLYIGANRPEKATYILSALMERFPEVPRGWIGTGPDIPHMQRLTTHARLTPSFVSDLAAKYDIFLNTSLSDANPTTVLEAMSWGFAVACTPGSGYRGVGSIWELDGTDLDASTDCLRHIQSMPESALLTAGTTNRAKVEERFTWDHFLSKLESVVQPFLQ